MRNDLTEIVVILDNSGSMASKVKDTVGGLNSFIEMQKAQPGEARFTLVEFSSHDKYRIAYNGVPLSNVGELNLRPSGNTALLDAIGRTINEVGQRLSNTPEDQRPGLVSFVIITDGEENNSKTYRDVSQIKEMIKHQHENYQWSFTYLGANQDAFSVGASIGTQSAATYDERNTYNAFAAASNNTARMRSQSLHKQTINNYYTKDEMKSIN